MYTSLSTMIEVEYLFAEKIKLYPSTHSIFWYVFYTFFRIICRVKEKIKVQSVNLTSAVTAKNKLLN